MVVGVNQSMDVCINGEEKPCGEVRGIQDVAYCAAYARMRAYNMGQGWAGDGMRYIK